MPNESPILLARHMRHHFVESMQGHVMDRAAIARVKTPVLTIHGTCDRNAPYGAGREWSFLLPNARLLTVRGAAHQVFAEYPDIVMPAVRMFPDGAWPEEAVQIVEDPRR
jgi:pimeloyl-ACP methyl ester carboxylesterase